MHQEVACGDRVDWHPGNLRGVLSAADIALAANPPKDSHVIYIPDFLSPPRFEPFDPCAGLTAA